MNIIRKLILGIVSLMFCMFISGMGWANNITVTNVARLGQVAGSLWMVRFNISWTNSWRCSPSEEPYNWDAAWVFIKWRTNDPTAGVTGNWYHASLSTNDSDHVAPAGSTINVGRNGRSGEWGTNGIGVFIYRSATGSGTFTANRARLRWNYAADGVADNTLIELKVCAIEMVYVPTGAFYVGTTTGGIEVNHFYAGGYATNTPFQITNENALTIGDAAGQLYYTNMNIYAGDREGILSNAYPKGFGASYGMKYEITQAQYADFLNMLTRNQQTNRFVSTTAGNFMCDIDTNSPSYRNGVQLISDPGAPNPRVYANNLDTNNAPNSTNDGQWIACNWLSKSDAAAYLDWAGLRLMTELEFEKACRGTNAPVANEYAWGGAVYTGATSIANGGMVNEKPGNATANCVNYNASIMGPMRVGCLGIGSGSRVNTGSGYYGMMELTLNLWELIVTVGNNDARPFTGQHGDGALDNDGNADVTLWPYYGYDRGSGFNSNETEGRVAERNAQALLPLIRYVHHGGRGIRTAP